MTEEAPMTEEAVRGEANAPVGGDQPGADQPRKGRRTVYGVVTSDKMAKTIVVSLERWKKHPKYLKYLRTNTKVHAHDEKEEAGIGDKVVLVSCRPMSKTKRWRLVEVTERSTLPSGGVS